MTQLYGQYKLVLFYAVLRARRTIAVTRRLVLRLLLREQAQAAEEWKTDAGHTSLSTAIVFLKINLASNTKVSSCGLFCCVNVGPVYTQMHEKVDRIIVVIDNSNVLTTHRYFMVTSLLVTSTNRKMWCFETQINNYAGHQSQIQDFPKEGARFRVKCHVDAIQWGGGGSSRFFP